MATTIRTPEDWKILLAVAEKNDASAQLEVAMLYESGIEIDGNKLVEINETLAYYWIKKAYENGNTDALVHYADYLSLDKSCEKNLDLAIKLYEKGIDLGKPEAAFNLGIEYRNKQDFRTAFSYYSKSNSLSSNYANFTIAKCYYYGIGTEKNKLKALSILENIKFPESYGYEVDEANYMIGLLYLEGEVIEQSFDTARRYFELANIDEDHQSAKEILDILGRRGNIC